MPQKDCSHSSADNVGENPDGTPRAVDWAFESTENDHVHTYIAYAEGTRPKPRRGTVILNRQKALGFISHRKDDKLLEIVNKKTSLERTVWDMGETTKENKEHLIGGHGMSIEM
jgi:hypothetical protein